MGALMLGVGHPMLALENFGYEVNYLLPDQTAARSLFRDGYAALVWPLADFRFLAFNDLSIDVAVLSTAVLAHSREDVIGEAVRILSPGGTLAFSETVPTRELEHMWFWELLEPTRHSNMFRRLTQMGRAIPVCTDCYFGVKGSVGRNNRRSTGAPRCQGNIPEDFVPLTDDRRKIAILNHNGDLDLGRATEWPIQNVLNTLPKPHSWADSMIGRESDWDAGRRFGSFDKRTWLMWRRQYVSADVSGILWPAENTALVRSGQAKSVLDAGSGSCSLDVHFRQQGIRRLLRPFVQFGAYDCSMARICGERGASQLDWDFLKPMPFCNGCTFDIIHQARAFHEFQTDAGPLRLAMDNFDNVLSCGGRMSIDDLILKPPYVNWVEVAANWAREKGYTLQYLANRTSFASIWIIKLC